MSEKTASSCATHELRRQLVDRRHRASCSAPSARRATDMPYTPAAANAFRSAWIPAPPPLSEVAIVSARGTRNATPFAGMTRIRFDGCDLSPAQGTPVAEAYPRRPDHVRRRSPTRCSRARSSPTAPRSPRARRGRPRPDELDPRVRDAIGVDGALPAPARGLGRGGARRAPRRHDRHRVGEDARVQPAGARRARARRRRTARSTSTRRRRSRRTSSAR